MKAELRGSQLTADESDTGLVHLPAHMAEWFQIPRSEARRMIAEGHVTLNGEPVTALDVPFDDMSKVRFR